MHQITSNNLLDFKLAYVSGTVPVTARGTRTPDTLASRRPTLATPELLETHFKTISELRKNSSVPEIIGAMKEDHGLLVT